MQHPDSWNWPRYYWNLCEIFGDECYRTWRWELFSSVVVAVFYAVVTRGWKDFKSALLATGLTLGCFALWHLIRVPFLLHQSVHGTDDNSDPGFLFGMLGIAVLAALFVGGYELALTIWNIKPIGEIVSNSADPGAKDARIVELERELREHERPMIMQIPPELDRLLQHQDQELSKLRDSQPSPRKKALQLSNDINKV